MASLGTEGAAALRAAAEETVLAMLSPDDADRADVITSLTLLPTMYPTGATSSRLLDGAAVFVPAAEAQELIAKQKAAMKSLQLWKEKDRTKTIAVGIVLCLNIGTDPPDSTRVPPYAREECWINPSDIPNAQTALDEIGNALKAQYERLQSKAKYRLSLDPTSDDVKKLANSIRKTAKEDRVLFHYNGHGVPKPTQNGEIWVFNANYTQYLPLSVLDLQAWLGSPAFYVFDCAHAGQLLQYFLPVLPSGLHRNSSVGSDLGATGRSHSAERSAAPPVQYDFSVPHKTRDFLVLASCAPNEMLPAHPEVPADLFTSCLTTPIKMALQWAVLRKGSGLPSMYKVFIERIPGRLSERRTPLGELNWIFTSITDTIAWTLLPRPLFFRLFRQDLLCASLFRNFLLADRIMRCYGCTPQSQPSLPQTHDHPLWHTWDAAVEQLLNSLPALFGYSQYDMRRMAAMDLKPDLSHLDPEWNELMPPLKLKEAASVPTQASAAASANIPTPEPRSARSASVVSNKHRRASTGGRKDGSGGMSAGLAALLPWAVSDAQGPTPLNLSVPPAASATADQRVAMLRKRLYAMMPSTSVGEATPDHMLGIQSYSSSTFFDEELTAFEVWLRNAAFLPSKLNFRLADVLLDFVQNGGGGFGGALAYNLAANSAATAASLAASSMGGSDPLNFKSLAAAAAVATVPYTQGFPGLQSSAFARVAAHRGMPHPRSVWLPLTVNASGAPTLSNQRSPSTGMRSPNPRHSVSAFDSSVLANNMMLAAAAVGTVGGTSASKGAALVPVLRIGAPSQLPILLQVLLSQTQRLKALQLLAFFVDLGHEAVNLAFVVGFYAYVCKLLQNASQDLMPTLVFVWAKFLTVDRDAQVALVAQGAVAVFVEYIQRMVELHAVQRRASAAKTASFSMRMKRREDDPLNVQSRTEVPAAPAAQHYSAPDAGDAPDIPGSSLPQIQEDQMTLALFVLCRIMEDHPAGQRAAFEAKLLPSLLQILNDDQFSANRQWASFALAMLLSNEEVKSRMVLQTVAAAPQSVSLQLQSPIAATPAVPSPINTSDLGHDTMLRCIFDPNPVVRAACAVSIAACFRDDEAINVVSGLSTSMSSSPETFRSPSGSSRRGLPQTPHIQYSVDVSVARHCCEFFEARCKSIVRHDAVPLSFVNASIKQPAESVRDDGSVISLGTSSIAPTGGAGTYAGRAAVASSVLPQRHAGISVANTTFSPMEIAAMAVRDLSADQSSTHAYLRAAWGFAYALYATSGSLPIIFQSKQEMGRQNDQGDLQQAKQQRKLALLRLLARRLKRTLMPSHVIRRMQAISSFTAAASPGHLSAAMTPAVSFSPSTHGSFTIPGHLYANHRAVAIDMPAPVELPMRTGTSGPIMVPITHLPVPDSMPPSASFGVGPRGSFTTDAPPADFLAEALAAAAVAEKEKGNQPLATNSDDSLASRDVGEALDRIASQTNFLAGGGEKRFASVASAGQLSVGHDSIGPLPVTAPIQDSNASYADSHVFDGTEVIPTQQMQSIADQRRAARREARAKLAVLQGEFVDTMGDSSRSLRELSTAVCLAAGANDASTAARRESLTALTRFVFHRTHECGLALAATSSLIDFLGGGGCLLHALKVTTEDISSVESGALAAALSADDGSGAVDAAPLSSSVAAKAAASKVAMDAKARQGFKLRLNLFNRIGSSIPGFLKESPKPPVPTVSAQSPSTNVPKLPSRSTRDIAALGLPGDMITLRSMQQIQPFLGAAYRSRAARDDGMSWLHITGSHEDPTEFDSCWMATDKLGTPDKVITSVTREIGPRGMLYLALWVTLLAGTTDPNEHCANLARCMVRRIIFRVAQCCVMETNGDLPKPPKDAVPMSMPSADSPDDMKLFGAQLKAAEIFALSSVDAWDGFPGPSASELGIRSVLYESSATQFYRPLLKPHVLTEQNDALSLTNLQRTTRHRLLQSALSEAVALGIAAYDDNMIRYMIEASGAIWTALQASQSTSVQANEHRKFLATVQKRALVKVGQDFEASRNAALVTVPHGWLMSSPGMRHAESDGSFFHLVAQGSQQGAQGTFQPAGQNMVMLPNGMVVPAGYVPAQLTNSLEGNQHIHAPFILAPSGSLVPAFGAPQELYASTYAGSVANAQLIPSAFYLGKLRAPPESMINSTPIVGPAGLSDGQYGMSPALLPPAAAHPFFMPNRNASLTATAATHSARALMPPVAPTFDAAEKRKPSAASDGAEKKNTSTAAPPEQRDESIPTRQISTSRASRNSRGTPTMSAAALAASTVNLPSDLPAARSMSGSFYGSQRRLSKFQSEYDGGGGLDARVSAALLANDASMLASSMGTSGIDDDADGGGGIGEAISAVEHQSSRSPLLQAAQFGGLTTIPEVSLHAEHDNAVSGAAIGHQQPSPFIQATPFVVTGAYNIGAAVPHGIPMAPWLQSSDTGAAEMPIAEEDLENQLRNAASITPRIPPALIARTRLATVQYARASARKMTQKCLFDGGSAATTGLLFHPWADFLVVADQSDKISSWCYQDGTMLQQFRNTTAGSASPYGGLWQPAWTPLLRQRVSTTAAPLRDATFTAPSAARIVGAPRNSAFNGKGTSSQDAWTGASKAVPPRASTASKPGTPAATPRAERSTSVEDADGSKVALPDVHRRVTSMCWINEHDSCHLLTGSEDGVVRIWDGAALASSLGNRNVEGPVKENVKASRGTAPVASGEVGASAGGAPPLIASFAALPELHTFPVAASGDAGADACAGLVLQWMPSRGHLIAGGGRAPYVRVWDLQAERCLMQVPVNVFSGGGQATASMHVTTLSSAWPGTDVLIAGTSNGNIQVLDLRVGGNFGGGSAVMTLREHKRYVVQVAQARSGSVYSLVSGSVTADVRFWDLRRSTSVHNIQAHRGPMTALCVHDYAPLIATGSRRQQVRIFTNTGDPITDIRYHDGFLGQRIGPVSTIAFHPNRLLMAMGALDSIVSVHHGLPPLE